MVSFERHGTEKITVFLGIKIIGKLEKDDGKYHFVPHDFLSERIRGKFNNMGNFHTLAGAKFVITRALLRVVESIVYEGT